MRPTALVLALVLSTGCYLGRSKDAKRSAYVLNGVALAAGTALLISSRSASSGGCDGCFDLGPSDQFIQSTLGLLFVVPAGIGIVANLATPTETTASPAPPPRARPAAPTVHVTGPGLQPAAVELR